MALNYSTIFIYVTFRIYKHMGISIYMTFFESTKSNMDFTIRVTVKNYSTSGNIAHANAFVEILKNKDVVKSFTTNEVVIDAGYIRTNSNTTTSDISI